MEWRLLVLQKSLYVVIFTPLDKSVEVLCLNGHLPRVAIEGGLSGGRSDGYLGKGYLMYEMVMSMEILYGVERGITRGATQLELMGARETVRLDAVPQKGITVFRTYCLSRMCFVRLYCSRSRWRGHIAQRYHTLHIKHTDMIKWLN